MSLISFAKIIQGKKIHKIDKSLITTHLGDPGTIRTYDLLLRRQLLYPAELRGRSISTLLILK